MVGLGDVAGALVIAPVIVLWQSAHYHAFQRNEFWRRVGRLATSGGLWTHLLFSPLIEQTPSRDPLGFLAILPCCGRRCAAVHVNTATVALVLAGITIWGTLTGGGPLHDRGFSTFLFLLVFECS